MDDRQEAVTPAEDKVIHLNQATPQARAAQKAQRKRQERREELIKNGVPENLVDQVLQQEEYRKLPIDQKVHHLEMTIAHAQSVFTDTMKKLASEMIALRSNQEEIADAFDVNLRALERVLVKLGIKEEDQKAILEEVTKEFYEVKRKRAEARAAAQKDPEKAAVEQEIANANKEASSVQG